MLLRNLYYCIFYNRIKYDIFIVIKNRDKIIYIINILNNIDNKIIRCIKILYSYN